MISVEKFGKAEHLVKTRDFRRVYKDGAWHKKDWLVLYALRSGTETNRVGFSVSARSVKLAVKRNRIKRLLREAYRRSKKDIKNGFDLVFSVKKAPEGLLRYEIVRSKVVELVGRAGILK